MLWTWWTPFKKYQSCCRCNLAYASLNNITLMAKRNTRSCRVFTFATLPTCASVAFVLCVFFGLSAQAAIYKWVDDKGKTHFSDSPPHKGAEEVKPRTGPSQKEVRDAREQLEETLQRLKRKEQIRQERREDERQRKAQAEQREAQNRSRCRLLQRDLHVLSQQRAVYTINEKGERIYMNDEARKLELARLKKLIASHCQRYQ